MTDIAQLVEQTRLLLKEDTASVSIDQVPRLPEVAVLQMHEEALRRAASNTVKRSITGYPKHVSRRFLEDLRPANLSDLRMGVNPGRCLVARVISRKPAQLAHVQIVAVDAADWAIQINVHHAVHAEMTFCCNRVFCLKEPHIKMQRDLPYVRVDTPSDVCFLEPHQSCYSRYQAFIPQSSHAGKPEESKAAGDLAFKNGHHQEAAALYTQSLSLSRLDHNHKFYATILLNRVACLLIFNLREALHDITALRQSDLLRFLSPSQQEKFHYRECQALSLLHRYQQAFNAAALAVVEYPSNHKLGEIQECARDRLAESVSGLYDWQAIQRATQKGRQPELGEYQNPKIKVVTLPGKGRGLVSTSSIAMGELLIVAHPLVMTPASESDCPNIHALNMTSESVLSRQQTLLPSLALHSINSDAALADIVANLHSGVGSQPGRDSSILDAGTVENICLFNQFKITSFDLSRSSSAIALYDLPSMMNHSCIGNSSYIFVGAVFVLRASRRIGAGEEIASSYVNAQASYEDRQAGLRIHVHPCLCHLCHLDRLDGKESREKRVKLLDIVRNLQDPVEIEAMIVKLLATYSAERSDKLKPEMYSVYRRLAVAQQTIRAPYENQLQTEKAALLSLGFEADHYATSELPESSYALVVDDALKSIEHIASLLDKKGDADEASRYTTFASTLQAAIYGRVP